MSLKILQRWLLTSESINIKGYKAKKVPVTPFNDPLLPDQSIPGITQTTEYPLIYVVFQNINFVVDGVVVFPRNFKWPSSVSADKFDLLWIDLLQMCLKRVFSITCQLNF